MNQKPLALQLATRLNTSLRPQALGALNACRSICAERGLALYLVGGGVRDLLLDKEGLDLDLLIESDVEPLARALAKASGARLVLHQRFGTASLHGRGFALDLARTRRETYPNPGALPVVEPATLAEDLARRDFTINAMALRLSPEPTGLVDPYRGFDDARDSLVRILHERSFQDDATRMLRAVRYAARLDFKIARQTEALLRRDLSFLGTISGPRLRRELAQIFAESRAVEAAQLAHKLGILEAIHPSLSLSGPLAARWQEALDGTHFAPLDELGFCILAAPPDEGSTASVSRWLHLSGRIEHTLMDLARLRQQSPKLSVADPVQTVEALEGASPAAVWALSVLQLGEVSRACLAYLSDWRHTRPALTGDDLLALGMQQGPLLGDVLRRIRAGRLEGRLNTRDEETQFVREALAGAEKGLAG